MSQRPIPAHLGGKLSRPVQTSRPIATPGVAKPSADLNRCIPSLAKDAVISVKTLRELLKSLPKEQADALMAETRFVVCGLVVTEDTISANIADKKGRERFNSFTWAADRSDMVDGAINYLCCCLSDFVEDYEVDSEEDEEGDW